MTPNVAMVEIRGAHWRGCRLWIPLFLLWIPLILLSPLILLGVLIAGLIFQVSPWQTIGIFWAVSCGLPGTDVRVQAEESRVLVRIL